MRIRILRGTVCNGVAVTPGQLVETDERQGAFLCQIGKAEQAEIPPPPPRPRGEGRGRERATVKPAERAVQE